MLWLLFFAIFIGYLIFMWLALVISGDIIGTITVTAGIIAMLSGIYTFIIFIVSANAYTEEQRELAAHIGPALATFVVSLAVSIVGGRLLDRKDNPHLYRSWSSRREIGAEAIDDDELARLNSLLQDGLISQTEFNTRLSELSRH